MKYGHLKLKILKNEFKYILCDKSVDLNFLLQYRDEESFINVFSSKGEISALVPAHIEVKSLKEEPGWRCIRIIGQMPFGSVQGLIAKISVTLIKNEIGICVISTYLTDLFYIKSKYLSSAITALKNDGWDIFE